MSTAFPASAHHAIACRRGRLTVCMAATGVAVLVSAWPAAAQAVYTYHGNNFTFFSCGLDPRVPAEFYCDTPADAGNPNTSYTAANFVLATLTLNEPLPPNPHQHNELGPVGELMDIDGHLPLVPR